jgi:hypothetical protein
MEHPFTPDSEFLMGWHISNRNPTTIVDEQGNEVLVAKTDTIARHIMCMVIDYLENKKV